MDDVITEQAPAAKDHGTMQPKTAAACERPSGSVALVRVNPDTPAPRCLIVGPDQRLRVHNATNRYGQPGLRVVAKVDGRSRLILDPGEAVTFREPVDELVPEGVHDLELTVGHRHWAAEIWLRDSPP